MSDSRARTRCLLVVALLGIALVIAPGRGVADWARPAAVEHSADERGALAPERDVPPSHLVDRPADVSSFKVAVTWTVLLAVFAALGARMPVPGRRVARSVAGAHSDQVRQRPRVPRAPPSFATTS